MSNPVNVGTIEAILKLKDEWKKSADEFEEKLKELEKLIPKTEKETKKLSDTLDKVGRSFNDLGENLTKTVTLPLLALGGVSVKAASDFESSFAGVRKTVDATEEEFQQLSQEIRDLAAGENAIPIDVNMLNQIAESAGQLGIAKENILDFTRTMADLGETTNLTALEASESIAQFQNIFGKAGQNVDRFGSTLVALGNAGASTEKSILDMGLRIAGAGNLMGLTQGEVLAWASALSSVGIEAEAGGSAISKVMVEISLAVSKGGKELTNFAAVSHMSAGEFSKLFREDASKAVQTFIEGLARIQKSGGDVTLILDQMGITEIRMRDALTRATGASKALTDSLELQAKAWNENTALTKEAEKRYQTFDSQLRLFKQQLQDIAITFGTALLPALRDGLEAAKPWIERLEDMAKGFDDLNPSTQKLIIVIAGLAAGFGPLLFVTGQLLIAWGQIIAVAPKVAAGIGAVGIAMKGLVVTGVLLFINELIKGWGEASDAVTRYNLEVAKIEGNALSFAMQVSQGPLNSTVTQDTFDQKIKEAEILQGHIVRIQNEVNNLNKIIKEGAGDQAYLAKQSLPGKEQELKSLIFTYSKLRTALANVTITGQEVEKTFDPGPFTGLDTTTEEAESAIRSVAKSIGDLKLKAEQAEGSLKVFLSMGPEGLKDKLLAIEQENAVRDINNVLVEVGLSLSKKQIDQINEYVRRESAATEELNKKIRSLQTLISVTSNLASSGFEKSFEQSRKKIQSEVAIIEQSVEEMLSALSESRELNLDLKFAEHSLSVSGLDSHLRSVEESYIDFLSRIGSGFEQAGEDSIEAGERIFSGISRVFGITVDDIKKKLGQLSDIDLALEFKAQLTEPKNATESLNRLKTTLTRLQRTTDETGQVLLTAAEANEIYYQAVSEGLKNFTNDVIGVVQTLGTLAGGTGKWNKALSGLSGVIMSGGMNPMAWLEMFIGIAEGGTNKGGVHFGAEIDTFGGSAQLSDSWTFVKGQLKEAQKAANEIVDSINETVEALGGILTNLPGILLEQKGEGWVVKIEGQLRRYFEEFDEAVAYAVSTAISESDISGVDADIIEALGDLEFTGLEDLREFLTFASEYQNLGLSDLQISLNDLERKYVEGARKATEYGLSIDKVSEDFGRGAQAFRDQILGIVRSPEDKLSQDVKDFNQWVEQEELSARIQVNAAQAQMDAAKLQMDAAWANIKGLGKDADPEMQKLFLDSQRLFNDAAARLDLWTKALDNLPDAISPEEEEEAKKRLKRGGGGGEGDSVKDFIEDRTWQLALRSMDEYARSQAEIIKQYDEQINQTKRDSAERLKLIALKEKELALLAREQAKSTVSNFKEFLGLATQFDQVRETASNLIKEIESSIFGDTRKAKMIGRVLADLDKQLERLSKESAVSLLGSMIQDLEKFGASEALMNEARGHMAVIEHTLKMEHYRVEIEAIKLQGKLSLETMAILDKGLAALEGIDINDIFSGNFPSAGAPVQDRESARAEAWYAAQAEQSNAMREATSEIDRLREAFKNAKDKILDTVHDFDLGKFGAVVPEMSLKEAEDTFDQLIADARAGDLSAFEEAPEAFQDLLEIMEKFSPALLATDAARRRDELESLAHLRSITEGNVVITDFEIRANHRENIDTLNAGFEDLSSHAAKQEEKQDAIILELVKAREAQANLASVIARLESSRIAVK